MNVTGKLSFVVSTVVLLSAVSLSLAQQDPSKPASKSDAKAADGKTTKPRAKPRGRLPAYYSKVVDGQQREKIYSIQQQHEPKIAALKAELKAAQDKLNAEVEAVLTPEQQATVKKLTEEAKAKRKNSAGATASTDADSEEEEADEDEADAKPAPAASKTSGAKSGK